MTCRSELDASCLLSRVAVACLEVGETFTAEFGYASPAEARVGRPLTPVSVAGVGRRTVRRCAAGVYYC